MSKIWKMKILKESFYYHFLVSPRQEKINTEICEFCDTTYLNSAYTDIIKTLQNHNLLPKDHIKMCCVCRYLFNRSEKIRSIYYFEDRTAQVNFFADDGLPDSTRTISVHTKLIEFAQKVIDER